MLNRRTKQVRLALHDGSYSLSTVHVLRGERAVLRMQDLLIRFSERCGLPSGTLLDLPYFLQKPGLLKRVPYLFLMSSRPALPLEALQPEDLIGTVLLLEYRLMGVATQAFATNDRSGSGTLLALPEHRMSIAAAVCELLISRGASVVMLSFAKMQGSKQQPSFQRFSDPLLGLRWALRSRSAPTYLQLCQTMDETLAGLGQKTRSNMRYYRRKAEKEFGCTHVPIVKAPVKELLQFNQQCMYAVPEKTLRWRLQVLQALAQPFLMGMKDQDGRWLSILAGRRFGATSEILWQLNRDGYSNHSFSTVMRSYCMEHEISRGAQRLQVEGGTFHSMRNSFEEEEIIDMVVTRPLARRMLRALVNRFVPSDNSLADMLKNRELQWYRG